MFEDQMHGCQEDWSFEPLFVNNKSNQINFYMLSDQEREEMFQHMKTGK